MKAKIQAMSMEAKASAMIIGALPVAVAMLVYITSRNTSSCFGHIRWDASCWPLAECG
jgi:Flp pilus assembly protein TadB